MKRILWLLLIVPLAILGFTASPAVGSTSAHHSTSVSQHVQHSRVDCTISIDVDHSPGFVDAHGRSCSETYNSWAFFSTPTNALKHGRGTTSSNGSAIIAQGNTLYGGYDRWQHNGTEHTYCTWGCVLFHKAGIRKAALTTCMYHHATDCIRTGILLAAFQQNCRPGWDDNVNTNNLTGAYAQADWETSGCPTSMQVRILCENVVTLQRYTRTSGEVTREELETRATCGIPDAILLATISFNDGPYTEFWPSRKALTSQTYRLDA